MMHHPRYITRMLCENVISIWSILIISQDKLFSPYHGSSAELVMVGVEPGTLRFQVDVITHYTTALQLIEYMPSECSMSLRTELCIVLSIECVLTEHSCRRCRVLKPTSSIVYSTCLLYTSPSPRDKRQSRMPSSA